MGENIKEGFLSLVGRLSPENLHMDGEASKTQVKQRLAQIRREWKALEKQAGRKVTEADADVWYEEKYYSFYNEEKYQGAKEEKYL